MNKFILWNIELGEYEDSYYTDYGITLSSFVPNAFFRTKLPSRIRQVYDSKLLTSFTEFDIVKGKIIILWRNDPNGKEYSTTLKFPESVISAKGPDTKKPVMARSFVYQAVRESMLKTGMELIGGILEDSKVSMFVQHFNSLTNTNLPVYRINRLKVKRPDALYTSITKFLSNSYKLE